VEEWETTQATRYSTYGETVRSGFDHGHYQQQKLASTKSDVIALNEHRTSTSTNIRECNRILTTTCILLNSCKRFPKFLPCFWQEILYEDSLRGKVELQIKTVKI